MADDPRSDQADVHPRPDQAEEPVDDVGASNVDLDEARHDDGHDDHGHDDHGDHPVEDARWVLAPIAAGVVLGVVLAVLLGTASDAASFLKL